MPRTDTDLETFARLMTANQSRLWAFVFSIVAQPQLAADVFQETNRVLWEKAGAFDAQRDFLPWAFAIAKMQARAARQAAGRDRLAFDNEVVERIADRAERRAELADERQVALAECLDKLPREHRELVEHHYREGASLRQIADRLGRTANSLGAAMFRIRRALADCIRGITREASA